MFLYRFFLLNLLLGMYFYKFINLKETHLQAFDD